MKEKEKKDHLQHKSMASATSTYARTSCILLPKIHNGTQFRDEIRALRRITARRVTRLCASQGPTKPPKLSPRVDTRIHWENPDDGWIGGGSSPTKSVDEDKTNLFSDEKFSELIKESFDSYYQFLGVSTDADLEEIKSVYRRLSKEYHPDTTSLPLKTALDKFMKIREVYDIFSDEENQSFYDWTLTKDVVSHQDEKMRMKLEDPKEQEFSSYESIPDMVDRLGVFAVCCIVFVIFFKDPSY